MLGAKRKAIAFAFWQNRGFSEIPMLGAKSKAIAFAFLQK